jgi:hypothetical protein
MGKGWLVKWSNTLGMDRGLLGIWALPLFAPFMVLSNCHHGNCKLSRPLGSVSFRWDFNEVRGCLVVTLTAILAPTSFGWPT